MIFALSTSAFAQSSSNDDDWLSADSPKPANTSGSSTGTYDGTSDSEFANDEEYASAYARYKTQTTSRSEISKQRKEGFSQSVFVGARVQGGFNTFLGSNSDGWGAGWNAGAGLLIKISMFTKNFSLVLGPLKKPTTNQHLYRQSDDGTFEDITSRFWRK